MGPMGAGILGLGGGLLAGGLISHEIQEGQEDAYRDGYQDANQDNYGGEGGFDDGGGGFDDGGGDVSDSPLFASLGGLAAYQ